MRARTASLVLDALRAERKGDRPGHPFRGNQHVRVASAPDPLAALVSPSPEVVRAQAERAERWLLDEMAGSGGIEYGEADDGDVTFTFDYLGGFTVKRSEMVDTVRSLLEDFADDEASVVASYWNAPRIAESGRFKNQHETDTSGGVLNPEARKRTEERMGATEDALDDPKLLPIYGATTERIERESVASWQTEFEMEMDNRFGAAQQYGSIGFVLGEAARSRATFTLGDSLGRYTGGSPKDGGDRDGPIPVPLDPRKVRALSDDAVLATISEYGSKFVARAIIGRAEGSTTAVQRTKDDFTRDTYAEVQVWGGLKMRDIARIDVFDNGGDPAPRAVVGIANRHGMPVQHFEADKLNTRVEEPRGVKAERRKTILVAVDGPASAYADTDMLDIDTEIDVVLDVVLDGKVVYTAPLGVVLKHGYWQAPSSESKGDRPGHAFRGNQHTGGIGGFDGTVGGYRVSSPDDPDYTVETAIDEWAGYRECVTSRLAAERMLGTKPVGLGGADPSEFGVDPKLAALIGSGDIGALDRPEGMLWQGRRAVVAIERAAALLRGVRDADPVDMPLYRSMVVTKPDAAALIALQPGDEFDISLASFSGSKRFAQSFGEDPKLGSAHFTLAAGAKGVVGGYPDYVEIAPGQWGEVPTDVVTSGRFRVTANRSKMGVPMLDIEQVGVFDLDNGGTLIDTTVKAERPKRYRRPSFWRVFDPLAPQSDLDDVKDDDIGDWLAKALDTVDRKGDRPGHPFRGNQHVRVGGAPKPERLGVPGGIMPTPPDQGGVDSALWMWVGGGHPIRQGAAMATGVEATNLGGEDYESVAGYVAKMRRLNDLFDQQPDSDFIQNRIESERRLAIRSAEHGVAIMRELLDAPAIDAPIYRGVNASASKVKVGDTIDLPLASFTTKESVARHFSRDDGVILKLPTGVGIPLTGRTSMLQDEQEVISGGRFKVAEKTNGGKTLVLEQVGLFDPDMPLAAKAEIARLSLVDADWWGGDDPSVRMVSEDESKGDRPGHPFRGNQHQRIGSDGERIPVKGRSLIATPDEPVALEDDDWGDPTPTAKAWNRWIGTHAGSQKISEAADDLLSGRGGDTPAHDEARLLLEALKSPHGTPDSPTAPYKRVEQRTYHGTTVDQWEGSMPDVGDTVDISMLAVTSTRRDAEGYAQVNGQYGMRNARPMLIELRDTPTYGTNAEAITSGRFERVEPHAGSNVSVALRWVGWIDELPETKGDRPGHAFRGNQHVRVGGGTERGRKLRATLDRPSLPSEGASDWPSKDAVAQRSTETLAALNEIEGGAALIDAVSTWKTESWEVDSLQEAAETLANGGTPNDVPAGERARSLLTAISDMPSTSPELLRGLSIQSDTTSQADLLADMVEKFKVGETVDLGLSSFTTDAKTAETFGEAAGGVSIILKTKGAKALPVENMMTEPYYAREREWITAGRFKVEQVEQVESWVEYDGGKVEMVPRLNVTVSQVAVPKIEGQA